MGKDEDLEVVVEQRIRPILDEASEKYLGLSIAKLSDDITSRLRSSALLDIEVDLTLPYREAKRKFRKSFLTKVLLLKLGNISEVARVTGQDRRSIHRLIKSLHINIRKIKKDLIRPYDVQVVRVNSIIEHVLDEYKSIIHPDRLTELYSNVGGISEEITKELPVPSLTFRQAQREFAKRYFEGALRQNSGNVPGTAKAIGLRQETLSRKLRALGMT